MIPWAFWMLVAVVWTISWVDIRSRYVGAPVIALLMGATLIGWSFGLWTLSILGGLLVAIAAWLIRLPLGDVFGLMLCGLLAGPLVAMTALMVSTLAITIFLALFGHRVSLVRHPFFPYCGALVLIFSQLFH